MSFLDDNKDYLLPLLGVVVVLIILTLSLSGESNFGLNWLTGYGGGNFNNSSSSGGTQTSRDQSAKNNKYKSEPKMTIDTSRSYTATMKTSKGEIVIKLLPKVAPRTVNNFVFLANEKFYDGMIFHRIIPVGLNIIQGGDPKGDGTGGPGYKFADEINADSLGLGKVLVKNADYLKGLYAQDQLQPYMDMSVKAFYEALGYRYITSVQSIQFRKGLIAMANSGPDTNGSQFFITMTGAEQVTQHLNGKHTVFGEVVSGQDVVDAIGNSKTVGNQGKPAEDIIIESVSIKVE